MDKNTKTWKRGIKKGREKMNKKNKMSGMREDG